MSLGLIFDAFGADPTNEGPSWCWVRGDLSWPMVLVWQLVVGKAWEMSTYVIVVAFYATIRCYLSNQVLSGLIYGQFNIMQLEIENLKSHYYDKVTPFQNISETII